MDAVMREKEASVYLGSIWGGEDNFSKLFVEGYCSHLGSSDATGFLLPGIPTGKANSLDFRRCSILFWAKTHRTEWEDPSREPGAFQTLMKYYSHHFSFFPLLARSQVAWPQRKARFFGGQCHFWGLFTGRVRYSSTL